MKRRCILSIMLAATMILGTIGVPAVYADDVGTLADETYVYADKMMDDFLAVYLRDHLNSSGQIVGKSTWRWSNHTNTPNASGELSRETDFWLSAQIFDSINDAIEYGGDVAKYKPLADDLYNSFLNAGYHPTWDVHVWTNNQYNDDLCWWSQAFERTYRLTGDQKYLDTAELMFSRVLDGWEDSASPSTRYGGAPYGGITWRATNYTGWANSGKNVCSNANAALIAARMAKTFAVTDPAKSATYALWATKIYDWAYAHLYKGGGYVIDTINSNGTESTWQFTYNYGIFAGAAYEMYSLFGDQKYLDACNEILTYGWNTMTLSDGLTITDEGQGDSAGFKLVMLRQTANIVYKGGLAEYERYLIANAIQAWRNRRTVDGLCGSNLAAKPKSDVGIASPCAIVGPVLQYYTGIDPTLDYDLDLLESEDGKDGVYQAEWAVSDFMAFDASQAGYTGTGYSQWWDDDGPHAQDGYIRFDVDVPQDGVYKLVFRWYTRGNNTRRMSINDGPITILNFTRSAASVWEDIPYYAYLKKGENSVKIIYYNKNTHPTNDQDMDSWLFIDYLKVFDKEPYPVPTQTMTSNGVNTVVDYTDGWVGSAAGQYVEFAFTAPNVGAYDLSFFYTNNGSTSSRELLIDGVAQDSLVLFPQVGPSWSNGSVVTISLYLTAGEHTVRLANNAAKGTAQYVNLMKYLGVELVRNLGAAEEMMDDFIAAYLRNHYDEDDNLAGLSTWRWTDNPDKGGGSNYEKRRETDFWLSALIFDTFNDALEYSGNQKYADIMDGLFESFIDSKWHPTWDVHDWMDNTYTDDIVWWAQTFERSYSLTGKQKYLDMALWMWEEIMENWDETVGYGGAPYGGFFWRRTAGDNVVNPTNASKNVCSNLNSTIAAVRMSNTLKTIDPERSAFFLEQAKKTFAWARAHLLRESDYYVYDNINYAGTRSSGQYTYNYGNFAGAAYELYAVTGDQDYLDIMLGTLRYAWTRRTGGGGTNFVQADGMTITSSEGTGDGAGFKMILIRQTASIVYKGGFTEFEKYLDWNASLAWNNRRASDGLIGVNLAEVPTATTDLASPCSALGPQLAFYTGLDNNADFGIDKAALLGKINSAKGIGSSGFSWQSVAALQAEIATAEGVYNNAEASSRKIAGAAYWLDVAVSKLRAVNHPAPLVLDGVTSVAFELEDGVYTDSVDKATVLAGFSGTGYAAGFKANPVESVSFDVDATASGAYDITLRSAVPLKNEALGAARTYNGTIGYGHRIDVTDGDVRESFWDAGAVSTSAPKWLQIDMKKAVEINLVRIRTRDSSASRSMDFSLWGGLDKNNLVELKASQRYQFTRVGNNNSTYSRSGNYVDIEIDPTLVRYLRVVVTYCSTNNGAEVSEFEAYAPVRTAALYMDGVKSMDFEMPVDAKRLTGESWETGTLDWRNFVLEDVEIPEGLHEIAIVSDGNTSGQYLLDKITFDPSAAGEIMILTGHIVNDRVEMSLTNRSGVVQSGDVYLAIYEKTGRLAAVQIYPFELLADGATVNHTYTLDTTLYPLTQYDYKLFCWDTKYAPMILPQSVTE